MPKNRIISLISIWKKVKTIKKCINLKKDNNENANVNAWKSEAQSKKKIQPTATS